jgi:hypothetical protein
MPSKQQSARSAKGSASFNEQTGSRRAANTVTSERDETYGVVSVLYHALQGAETVAQYVEDARRADDEEAAAFFMKTQGAYVELAREAKELLAARIDVDSDDDDDDEDDED